MKKIYNCRLSSICLIAFCLVFFRNELKAQCVNADFSDGNFTGWTGTYFDQCTSSFLGTCLCSATNPTANAGFNQGPNDKAPNFAGTEYSQIITSTGNDPFLSTLNYTLPTVYPGNAYSSRIGNMWQALSNSDNGDGETISYSFTVNASNSNFTYHYAVVLNDGGHPNGQQPFFNISMVDGSGNAITCADYEVDATLAQTIGGFTEKVSNKYGDIWIKPWTSVFIPLNNYVGQTVKITFTTRGCLPNGCAGAHFAYAYIAAECAPLTLVASSPTVCGGTGITLTAPAGAATYVWSGPGIVSGGNTQIVTIDQPGPYSVTMTTFGNTPCTFTLDTIAPANPHNPSANFSFSNTCVGSPTQFTDLSTPAGQVTTWAWNFGAGTATTQNPTYTFPAAGTYPVKLSISWPPCTADTTINVVVSSPPVATFTASSPVCEGTNSNIVYTGGAPAGDTYTWNFSGGTVASGSGQGPYQVNWLTGGNKTISLTVAAGTCSSPPATEVVVVNPFAGLVAPPDTSICTGGNVTLVASGANSYTWSPAAGLNSTTTATVIATPATTTTYTVTGSSANCNATAYVKVAVNPVPTSTFTVTNVCAGQPSTITYTGNAGPSADYIWNFNGGVATPAGGQGPLAVTWAQPGNQAVSLTVMQSGCSSPQTPATVVVSPNATSTFTVTSPVCTGDSSLVVYTGNAGPMANYTWNFAGATIHTTAGSDTIYCVWNIAGTNTLSLSVSQNGCTSPPSQNTVVVNQIPTADFSAVPQFMCAGDTTTLTYTGIGTNTATYNWGFAGGTASPGGTTRGPQYVTWANAGVDSVTLQVTQNGCVSPIDTVPITVLFAPNSLFTVTTPICNDSTTLVTYTGNGQATDVYDWDFAGGTFVTSGPDAFLVTFDTAGTKNIVLVVSASGCVSPPTIQTVIVHPNPTATFTINSPLCAGAEGTITYTGTGSTAGTYTWNFDGGNANPTTGEGPIQISWATAGSYAVILNVVDSGCPAIPDTVPVIVNPLPVSDAGDDTIYCEGNTVIIGTASTPGYTYAWSPNEGLSSATASNPSVSITDAGDYTASRTYTVVTTNSFNCSTADSVNITVVPVPQPEFAQPAPECLTGNTFSFDAGGVYLPDASFSWSFGADAVPSISAAIHQTVSYTAATTSAVTLSISQTYQYATCKNSFTDSVSVYPMPQPLFMPDTTHGCPNLEVCFANNSVSVSPSAFVWNFGDGSTSADSAPCHVYANPGKYSIYFKVTSSEGCTTDTTMDTITVIPNPIAAFMPSAIEVVQPQSEIDFTNQSLYSVTYLWTYSSVGVDNAIIGSSTNINPVYNFTQYGLYNVMLYAYNAYGCVDSTQQPVTVLPPKDFFIPNVFTPNGDGVNDDFYVFLQEGATLREFRIFDRWGEKVHDGLYAWDGTYEGKTCPPGVYVYVAVIHLDTNPGDILRKGSVTLVR